MAVSRDRSPKSLEALLRGAGGAVRLLRGSNLGPYTFPVIPPGVHELARRAARLEGRLVRCSSSPIT